jgi:hypothetical protein
VASLPSFLVLQRPALLLPSRPLCVTSSFFFFAVLGFELRAYTLSHSGIPFFVMGIFEIRSHELFARVGFEP